MKYTPAIVAIGFNRPGSLSRLLTGLDRAWYPEGVDIPLVIAIDYQDSAENAATRDVAEAFIWKHGSKRIIAQKENLGLKRHVLACGDLTQEYGAIIMLEDDIFPGHNFYAYTIQALDFYQDEDKVAGISLYNHKRNFIAGVPFEPITSKYDNYFLQLAASWGQAWSIEQWDNFKKWYNENTQIGETPLLPDRIRYWSDHSWLKHYDHYLVMNNLYFVYPYVSQTTNFSDVGTHARVSYPHFQVSIEIFLRNDYQWNFSIFSDSMIAYDAYFELSASVFARYLDVVEANGLVVDLYGSKPLQKFNKNKLVLSSREIKPMMRPLRQFGMQLKPLENNVFYSIPGEFISLSKLSDFSLGKSKLKSIFFALELLEYFYGRVSQKIMFYSLLIHLKRKFKL